MVSQISYGEKGVEITTKKGVLEADYAVVTLPIGVLKADAVRFEPALPNNKRHVTRSVAMGHVNKMALLFDEAFWDVGDHYFGYAGEEKGELNYFLNARTFTKANALMTFGFGTYGLEMESFSDKEATGYAMEVLRDIFDIPGVAPTGSLMSRWTADPFSRGAYAFYGVGTRQEHFATLAEPVADRLFFAGEHTSVDYVGTVHGAHLSGLREAERIDED